MEMTTCLEKLVSQWSLATFLETLRNLEKLRCLRLYEEILPFMFLTVPNVDNSERLANSYSCITIAQALENTVLKACVLLLVLAF